MRRFILIILLSISSFGFSQDFIGGIFGYNNQLFEYSKNNLFQAGIHYEKKILNNQLAFYTDVFNEHYTYQYSSSTRKLSYLKSVLGVDINVGKKAYFLFGIGMAPKFLIQNKNYLQNPRKFVLDAKINSGIGFHASPKLLLSLTYQVHFNITPNDVTNRPDHLGRNSSSNEYDGIHLPVITISYKIKTNK